MTVLSRQPAHPRQKAVRPAYPTALSLAVAMTAAACGQSSMVGVRGQDSALAAGSRATPSPDEIPARVLVVSAVPPVQTGSHQVESPAPPAPPMDLLADIPIPTFPEDNLNSLMVISCGGMCPPAYVVETEARDRRQLAARLKFCGNAGRVHLPSMSGSLSVTAHIDADGRAHRVVVDATEDIPAPVASCVQRLVESAVYFSKYNHERDAATSRSLTAASQESEDTEP
jgi:hypothetical protein